MIVTVGAVIWLQCWQLLSIGLAHSYLWGLVSASIFSVYAICSLLQVKSSVAQKTTAQEKCCLVYETDDCEVIEVSTERQP